MRNGKGSGEWRVVLLDNAPPPQIWQGGKHISFWTTKTISRPCSTAAVRQEKKRLRITVPVAASFAVLPVQIGFQNPTFFILYHCHASLANLGKCSFIYCTDAGLSGRLERRVTWESSCFFVCFFKLRLLHVLISIIILCTVRNEVVVSVVRAYALSNQVAEKYSSVSRLAITRLTSTF